MQVFLEDISLFGNIPTVQGVLQNSLIYTIILVSNL